MRLRAGARVAVVGAGPSGLVAAAEALQAGFVPTVLEASGDLGGQWNAGARHSGVWPGLHTNTSRSMTAFSRLPPASSLPLFPSAQDLQAYLRRYAVETGIAPLVRYGVRVGSVAPAGAGWAVDGEPYDAVVLATGRFSRPRLPDGVRTFTGPLLHAFDFPGREALAGRRVLVHGNGVSALEIAGDLAGGDGPPVVAAFRRPRWVLRKEVDGVANDCRWYTHARALERRLLPRDELARRVRARVLRVAGDPADFGAPAPDPDVLVAGTSLGQDWLEQVRAGRITCRPDVAAVDGTRVTFADGSTEDVDVVVCATGYDLDLPYLAPEVARLLGPDLRLHLRTLHPDLPGLAFLGQFALQGPYLPLLELQARWAVGVWAGEVPEPDEAVARASLEVPPPPVDAHDALALALSEAAGVGPDVAARPELAEPLLHGPMLPARYRLDGPGALPGAADLLRAQLAVTPRAPVDPTEAAAAALAGYAPAST